MDIERTNTFYHEMIGRDDFPETGKNLMHWYLQSDRRSIIDEALDLMQVIDDPILPAPLFEWLCTVFLEAAAENPAAWNDLGVLYYSGRSGLCDLAKARMCYEKGDQSGDLNSSQNLGYLYRFGQGMEQDLVKAWYFFTKGALAGMPASMLQLARMMEEGQPFEKDLYMAWRLYERLFQEADPDEELSLCTAVCLGMARILEQCPDTIDTWLTPETLYEQAFSMAEDAITAENDPLLYKELMTARTHLEKQKQKNRLKEIH